MIMVLAIVVVVTVTFFICCIGIRRHGQTRSHKKAAAEDALREQYGRYWTQARALAERHLLEAPADDEWLDGIRARALPADTEQPPVPAVASRHSSRSMRWQHVRQLTTAVFTIAVPLSWAAHLVHVPAVMVGIILVMLLGPAIGILVVIFVAVVHREANSWAARVPDSAERGTHRLSDPLTDRGSTSTAGRTDLTPT